MNKKILGAIALVAVLGGGLFLVANRTDSPATSAPSSSTSTPTEAPTSTPALTISTFTAEVNHYKSINGIAEADKIPEDGLEGLYNHLKGVAKINPNVVENEDNEYFPGYLDWYNTKSQTTGKETDVVPEPVKQQQEELNKYKDEKLKEVMTEIYQNYTPEEVQKLEELFEYVPAKKDAVVSAKNDMSEKGFNHWLESLISDTDRVIEEIKLNEALKQADTSGKDSEFFKQHGH